MPTSLVIFGLYLKISYKEFERVEHLVSEGLKDGHKGIESAAKAQRRTHGSLEAPHHRTSPSSVRLSSPGYFPSRVLDGYLSKTHLES